MSMMKIPRGNIIELRLKGKLIPSVPMINTEDISLKISTRYKQIMGSESNPLMATLSQINALQGIGSGVTSISGFQVWESTEPITFSAEVVFHMRTSGKKDVMTPIQDLVKLVVPQLSSGALTLIAPGPTIKDALQSEGIKTEGMAWSILSGRGTLTLRVGNFIYLPSVIITSAEPTFSMSVDSNGYPVFGSVRLEFSSIDIANSKGIDDLTAIPYASKDEKRKSSGSIK